MLASVLGLLLFLTYINDLVELLASFNITIELFADDVKLHVKVLSRQLVRQSYRMQFQPMSHGLKIGSYLCPLKNVVP